MCPLFRGSTVHKEEDNLSIVDKMAGPNVSFIQRVLHTHNHTHTHIHMYSPEYKVVLKDRQQVGVACMQWAYVS